MLCCIQETKIKGALTINHIVLKETPYHNQDFLNWCSELDTFLNQTIGEESKREKYQQFNHLDTMGYVVLAYDKDLPAGCAALRPYSSDAVELKRVFEESKKGIPADRTAATAGSILGAIVGKKNVPTHWYECFHNTIDNYLIGVGGTAD